MPLPNQVANSQTFFVWLDATNNLISHVDDTSAYIQLATNATPRISTANGSINGTLTITTANVNLLQVAANANFDSGTLFVDATNNRVGIGNTTPTHTLRVEGDSSFTANANFDSGTLFVDATNNRVGIGNTIPSHTLRVQGTASVNGALTTETTATFSGAVNALSTLGVGSTLTALGLSTLTGNVTFSGSRSFFASGSVLDWNAGDVTITHATDALTFAGAASGYTFNDGQLIVSKGTTSEYKAYLSGTGGAAGNYVGLLMHQAGSASAPLYSGGMQLLMTASSPSFLDPALVFVVQASGTSAAASITERMRITSTGNVGIGNTSPTHKLRVEGTASITANLTLADSLSVTGTITGNLTGTVSNATNLNSQPGSYYTNATNLNAGTVPVARLPIATSSVVGAAKPDNGTITVDGAGTLTVNVIAVVPSGTIVMTGSASAPSGWLFCNGAGYSTTTYASLFAAIGYTYGGSAGTFNVPDLRNKFPVGAGTSFALASTGGALSHTHTISSAGDHNHGGTTGATSPGTNLAGSHSHTAATGGTAPGTSIAGSHSHGTVTGATAPGTDAQGSHSHTVDSHSHTVTAGNHSHTVSTSNHTHSISASGTHTHYVSGSTTTESSSSAQSGAYEYSFNVADDNHYHDFGVYSAGGGDHSHGGATGSAGGESLTTSAAGGGTITSSAASPGTNLAGSHSHTVASHTHSISADGSHSHTVDSHTHSISADGSHSHTVDSHSHTITTGGAHDHGGATGSGSSLPPYLTINYIIKT